jgi:hypothetical protein
MGNAIFGFFSQAPEVNDEFVETHFVHVLRYIDANLAIFNRFLDRRFDKTLEMIYPEISSEASLSQLYPAENSIISSMDQINKNSKTEVSQFGENHDKFIDYRKYPSLIRIIWHEILIFCLSIVEGITEAIKDKQLRQAKIIDSMVEYLKSLFHCKMGANGVPKGIPLDLLESLTYRDLRNRIQQVFASM